MKYEKNKMPAPACYGNIWTWIDRICHDGNSSGYGKNFFHFNSGSRTLYFIVRTWRCFRLNFARDFWQNKTIKKYFNSSCFCFHSCNSFSCIFSKLSVIMCIKVYCRIAPWCFFWCWRYCCRKTCR